MSTETDSLHQNANLQPNLQPNRKQIEIPGMTDKMRDQMTDQMTKETLVDTTLGRRGMIEALEMTLLVNQSTSTVIREDHDLLHSDRSMK
jgi:hypothetical protein